MVDSDEQNLNFQILNAHDDDIHGLQVQYYQEKTCIISGGKDGNIKCWDYFGKLNHYLLSKDQINYRQWITSLSCFKNGYTIGGTRDGAILIYDQKHKFIKKFNYNKKQSDNYYCKENNQKRILCTTFDNIAGIKTDSSFNFYVGTPKYLHIYNSKQGKIHTFTETQPENKSDWVYCFQKLEQYENKYFMVLGPYLKIWQINNSNFNKTTVLADEVISERMLDKKQQRQSQYISDITQTSQSTVMGAFFDGTIREIDVQTGKFVSIQQQHQGRVWRVLKMHNMLISSADDGKVNFYDQKSLKMISQIDQFDGRVSQLQQLDQWNLLTSSCPDNLSQSQHRAVIACWDIRKLPNKGQNGMKDAKRQGQSVEFQNEKLLQQMQQLKIEENQQNTTQ